jgi:hypothetical protein
MYAKGSYGKDERVSDSYMDVFNALVRRAGSNPTIIRFTTDKEYLYNEMYFKVYRDAYEYNFFYQLFHTRNTEGAFTDFDIFSTFQDALDGTNAW